MNDTVVGSKVVKNRYRMGIGGKFDLKLTNSSTEGGGADQGKVPVCVCQGGRSRPLASKSGEQQQQRAGENGGAWGRSLADSFQLTVSADNLVTMEGADGSRGEPQPEKLCNIQLPVSSV